MGAASVYRSYFNLENAVPVKTLLAYHDKQKGQYATLDNIFPLLDNERFEPFLMTSREIFTVQTNAFQRKLDEYPIRAAIKGFKNTISTILLLPGIITALLYIVDFTMAIAQSKPISTLVPEWITNLAFWIAAFGVMILWHETYRTSHQTARILLADPFSELDIKAIKQGDLGLTQKIHTNILDVCEPDLLNVVSKCVRGRNVDMAKLFSLLLEFPDSTTIFDRLNISDKVEEISLLATTENMPATSISALRSLLIYATDEAIQSASATTRPEHMLIAFFKVFEPLNQYLKKRQLNVNLMRFVSAWIELKRKNVQNTRIFDPRFPYLRTGGIASSWVYGYTFVLSHYSRDLTQEVAKKGGHYGIGHDSEMEELIAVLSKMSKKHVLLVGESGTGKTSIAKGLAERINRGTVPPILKDHRVIQLDVNSLVAGAGAYQNLENLVQETMRELEKAGNTILFIDEIQEITGTKGEESQHTLAGILLPYILESRFPVMGTITFSDYKKFFYARESLRQVFQTVEIREVSPEAAFEIILTQLEQLEKTYGIRISFPAIFSAVELAQRYVYDRKLPDSAVNIMEAACASMQDSKDRLLTPEIVSRVVSQMTDIPVSDVTADEATKLLDLENNIKEKVIGQDIAVHQIVEALKRSRTGIRDPNRPIGSFLFLGPTGVGKTLLAKTVGNEYFGDKHKMIRIDMSEYKDISSVSRLIGTGQIDELAQTAVTFLDQIKLNPFSVVLLDEIEKAHPQVLDLFLQVLDEGHMTNTNGETINFDNTIIIATSNIGSKTLLDALEKDNTLFEEAKERVMVELRESLRIEFLNRFDQIIVFSPHTKENYNKIAELLLKELKNRLLEKEITIQWEENLPPYIVANSYQPGLGARPMRRYVQDYVETAIAQEMLEGRLKPGDTYLLTPETIKTSTAAAVPQAEVTSQNSPSLQSVATLQHATTHQPATASQQATIPQPSAALQHITTTQPAPIPMHTFSNQPSNQSDAIPLTPHNDEI